ncbi:hypothetical protein [Thalassotalea piscium]|uniref:Uncharacterized protein n=1 Tax=Thalassotalea piscium TaxID=1230533 RepID=A0A7X0NG63_9GAMM|nr:hypothetical protein [Thalassotalea piscium]MBB6542859.1 hypothetical protein [Thalassotalea piscium]
MTMPVMPNSPVATQNSGSGWLDTINTGLSNALDLWGRVEQIKAQKSSQGGDLTQAKLTSELTNGSATVLDSDISTTQEKTGFTVEKPVLYASLALLGLAFVLRMKGFK